MSMCKFYVPFVDVSLAANTAKSVVSILAAANHNVRVDGFEVWFDDTVGSDKPVLVELVSFGTDGTGSANTCKITNLAANTLQTTSKNTYTAEPSTPSVLRSMRIHPQGGIVTFPPGESLVVAGGGILCLRLTSVAAIHATGGFFCEE